MLGGWQPAFSLIGTEYITVFTNAELAVIPLFLLMEVLLGSAVCLQTSTDWPMRL